MLGGAGPESGPRDSGKEALRWLLQAGFRRHPARREHADHGRLRNRRADPPAAALRDHADHLHQRRQRHGDARLARLLVRRGRLHPDAGRAGNPAGEDRGLRRSLQKDRAGQTAGRRTRRVHSRAGGARRSGSRARSGSPFSPTRATSSPARSSSRRRFATSRIWSCRGWRTFASSIRRRKTELRQVAVAHRDPEQEPKLRD